MCTLGFSPAAPCWALPQTAGEYLCAQCTRDTTASVCKSPQVQGVACYHCTPALAKRFLLSPRFHCAPADFLLSHTNTKKHKHTHHHHHRARVLCLVIGRAKWCAVHRECAMLLPLSLVSTPPTEGSVAYPFSSMVDVPP